MHSSGFRGYRRLFGLSAVLISLLVVTVVVTSRTADARRALSSQRIEAVELAEHATALRFATNDLFSWQIASAMGVIEGRDDALDPDADVRRRYRESFASIVSTLDTVAASVLSEAQRTQVDSARTALTELARIDQAMEDDYRSGDAVRRRSAVQVVTSTEIEQFQVASTELSTLATLLTDSARQAGDESAALNHQVQLMLVGLTAAMITAMVGLALWVWRGDRRQHAAISQLAIEANLDPLTNVANRRLWNHALDEELRRARHDGGLFTVTLIDLDHFKVYNDTYGHPAGDRHLRMVADILVEAVRRNDLVARLGGEEFALLLSGSAASDAARVVDRIQPLIPNGQTLSAGIAQWNGTESAGELIARADLALYDAKAAGRNRLALAA